MTNRSAPTTAGEVWEALSTVIDPELGVPITDLGLVYGVDVDDGSIRVELTTTTPICPLGEYLVRVSEARIEDATGISSVEIALTHDPPWTPDRMNDTAREMLGWVSG